MDDDGIAYILGDVESIKDITAEHLDELRETGLGRFPIIKFNVTPSEYRDWRKLRGGGYEYDAQSERLVIKAAWGMLHDGVNLGFQNWFTEISRRMRNLTGTAKYTFNYMVRQCKLPVHCYAYYPRANFFCIALLTRGILAVMLSGPFNHSFKEPDVGFHENSSPTPVVAVEIGIGEGRKRLFEDSERWLEGTRGKTRVVILVDIEENFTPEQSQRMEEKKNIAYGLSYKELKSSNTTRLSEHILEWYEKNNEALVGEFTAHIYICRRRQRPRKVLRYNFSLDKPGETAYVSDQAYVSTTELMGADLSTLKQQGMAEGDNCEVPSDSEDEDSYANQKLKVPPNEQIPLPLENLKNRMEKCIFFQRIERVDKKAKAIMRRFDFSNKAR